MPSSFIGGLRGSKRPAILYVGSGLAHSSQLSKWLISDYVALGKVFMAFFFPMVLLSELDINLNTYFFIHLFIFIGNILTCFLTMHTEATAPALAHIHALTIQCNISPPTSLSSLSESVLSGFFLLMQRQVFCFPLLICHSLKFFSPSKIIEKRKDWVLTRFRFGPPFFFYANYSEKYVL